MSLPKEIADFMATYGVEASELWAVRPGTYAIKHKALERVAARQKIVFDPPTVIEANSAEKIAVICVTARWVDRSEWSIGEASPANNKNAYAFAMAEKRAKDRCVLKLLQAHGTIYSEDEADDFKQPRQNPHVTRPEDILPRVQYDQFGEPIDNIPSGDPSIDRLPKKDARKDFEQAQKEMRATKTIPELEAWGKANANRVQSYPADWSEMFRGLYAEHLTDLREKQKEAA